MDFQEAIRHPYVINTGLFLARVSPQWLGYAITDFVNNRVAKKKPRVYWVVYNNLKQVLGNDTSEETLHKIAHQTFLNSGHYYYHHYHNLGQPMEEYHRLVKFEDSFWENIQTIRDSGQGVAVLSNHFGPMDLGGMAFASKGIPIQVLSLAAPPPGFQILDRLREEVGMIMTPITPNALKQGVDRLRKGGVVVFAIDWPTPNTGTDIEFFGKPSYTPLGAAKLALMGNAKVIILTFYEDPANGYKAFTSDPIELIKTGNRKEDVLTNTRVFMEIYEPFIRKYPEQWMMFHDYWPRVDEE